MPAVHQRPGDTAAESLPAATLRRELHRDDIAVGHRVLPPLQPQRPALAGAGVAAGVDELVPADDLGAHEAALDVGVDLAGRVPGGQAAALVPGLCGLVLAGRE